LGDPGHAAASQPPSRCRTAAGRATQASTSDAQADSSSALRLPPRTRTRRLTGSALANECWPGTPRHAAGPPGPAGNRLVTRRRTPSPELAPVTVARARLRLPPGTGRSHVTVTVPVTRSPGPVQQAPSSRPPAGPATNFECPTRDPCRSSPGTLESAGGRRSVGALARPVA
jgi:hypothetical protein